MIRKVCNKCRINKNIENFHKRLRSKDGYNPVCKMCRQSETKKYYLNNIETIKEKNNEYKKENKKRILEVNKKYRENNKEFVDNLKQEWSKSENGKLSRKKYYERNSVVIKKKVKEYAEQNKELIKLRKKKERQTIRYKQHMSEYIKKHRKLNPHIYAWRSLLWNTLKRIGTKKENKTIDLLGYSALDLKLHIEKQFENGMNWENWGEWHIDHKMPVSKFEKTESPNVINALTNLKPLWALENLQKYNKINY